MKKQRGIRYYYFRSLHPDNVFNRRVLTNFALKQIDNFILNGIPDKGKVIIGLSGGVDSSVAAYLLQEQGYDVEGLFMINWKDSSVTLSGDCTWEEDILVARLVAKKLGIPLHVVDSSDRYMERVVNYMFREYGRGRTPNPDVLCNREIKFDVFLAKAVELGAEWFATGHYCRKDQIVRNGRITYRLLAGLDPAKDQSYFLCQLNQEQIGRVLFPIGHMMKNEVRKIASDLELATAERKDSQGICFVGKVDLPVFLRQKLESQQGDIVEIDPDDVPNEEITAASAGAPEERLKILASPVNYRKVPGNVVGRHRGAWYFTIGQRKGLNVGGKKEPLFIIATDPVRNIVYTGMGEKHPGLYRKGLFIRQEDIHWLRPDLRMNPGEEAGFLVRIRYRQALQPATLFLRNEGMYVIFDKKQRGITAGQFAAWYAGDELVGSGVIDA